MRVAAVHNIKEAGTPAHIMVTPWRRRRMCLLMGETPAPAGLREVSGRGAFVETNARPDLQSKVLLHHPEAGMIEARVAGFAHDGVRLAFAGDAGAVAFALAAITADMTQG